MATRRVKQADGGYRGLVTWVVKKLVRWLLLLLAIPLTVWAADKIAEQVEQRRGPSNLTRTLRAPGRWRRGEPLLAD
jgi:hypothetical protein